MNFEEEKIPLVKDDCYVVDETKNEKLSTNSRNQKENSGKPTQAS